MDETTGRADAGPGRAPGPGPATRRAARNAAAVAVAEIAGKLATFAYTIAAARILGEVQFGAFAYALSFALLVATLPSWGFDPLLVQRGSREPQRLAALMSETLTWRTAIAVPVFLAAGIAGVVLRPTPESAIALVVVLAATAVDVYSDVGRAAAAALQDQVGTSKALVLQRLTTAALAIGALVAGFGLVGLSLAYLGGTLAGAVGVVGAVRRLGVGIDLRSVHREGLLKTGRLSIAMGIDAVASLALFRIDQVMLGAIQGDGAVGVYAAAYRLLETVLFLSWAVAKAVFPVMSAATESWRVRRGVEQGLGVLATLYVPFGVGLWLEAEPVLRLLYGEPYAAQAAGATRWLAGAPLIFGLGYLVSYGLLSRERGWEIVLTTVASLGVNIALNVVLIPPLSSTGAAISTIVSYGVEALLALVLLARLVGWMRFDRVLAPSLAASAVMAAVVLAVPGGLAVEVPLGMAVYGAVWFLLARWWQPEHLSVIGGLLPARLRSSRSDRPDA